MSELCPRLLSISFQEVCVRFSDVEAISGERGAREGERNLEPGRLALSLSEPIGAGTGAYFWLWLGDQLGKNVSA
jgi:hypothetical protein